MAGPSTALRTGLPTAVEDAPDDIGDDEDEHAADHDGDEDPVEDVDVEDQRRMLRVRRVVAEPSGREIGRGIRMAATASDQQVLLDDGAVRVVDPLDVVDAVAIDADRFVGL